MHIGQGPHIPVGPWVRAAGRGRGHGAARRAGRDSAVTHRAPKETCHSREHRPAPAPSGGSARSQDLGVMKGKRGGAGPQTRSRVLSSPTEQSLGWPQSLEEFTFPWQTHAPGVSPALPAFLTPTPCGARSGQEGAVVGTGSWAGGPQHQPKLCWTQAAFLVIPCGIPGFRGQDMKAESDYCSAREQRQSSGPGVGCDPKWLHVPLKGLSQPQAQLSPSQLSPSQCWLRARTSLLSSAVDFERSKMFVLSTRA